MQLMIDTLVETPEALDLAAAFLQGQAALRRAVEAGAGMPHVPMGTQEPTAAPFVPAAATPAAPTPNHSTATVAPLPPLPTVPNAAYPSSATPAAPIIAPPAPPTSVPVATTPATSTLIPAPNAPTNAPVVPGASGAPSASDEYDRAGVPWDVRIHRDGKSQKKDGTWKLRKKIDSALVEAVMRELTPRIRVMTPAPTAPSAPPVPAPVLLPQAPPPPAPQGAETQAPLAPPPPPPPAAPPIPGAEAQAPIDPFRALVAKITKARAEKRLTPEEVTQAVTGAGVASLQLLNAMPHKVAEVEANIDAILVTR